MHIVDTMHLDRREVQLGTTKVFIKSPESVRMNLLLMECVKLILNFDFSCIYSKICVYENLIIMHVLFKER